jgi:hypothetical protein
VNGNYPNDADPALFLDDLERIFLQLSKMEYVLGYRHDRLRTSLNSAKGSILLAIKGVQLRETGP